MSFAGGLFGGAIGGGLAVTVLAPLTAANNFLGSYFFGSGMILGERQMYQDDWIKIKKRLDAGESFLVILEEVMKPNTQAIMQMARQTVIAVSAEWNDIVLKYLQSIPQSIWDAINKINAGEELDNPWPLGEGIIGFINGVVQCHTDYHRVGNTCVINDERVTAPQPPPPTEPVGPTEPSPPTSPGFQPKIRAPPPPIKFPVSPSVQKLYDQFVAAYKILTRDQNAWRTALRKFPQHAKARTWIANISRYDTLRSNKINQIRSMERSYRGLGVFKP